MHVIWRAGSCRRHGRWCPLRFLVPTSRAVPRTTGGRWQEMNSLGDHLPPKGWMSVDKAPASHFSEGKFWEVFCTPLRGLMACCNDLRSVLFNSLSLFPFFLLPGITSQVNYIHQSPCLGICFRGAQTKMRSYRGVMRLQGARHGQLLLLASR